MVPDEGDLFAVGRDRGRAAIGEPARRIARERRDPDGLLDTGADIGGVRRGSVHLEVAAADIDDGAAVGSPRQIVDLLAVVLVVRGQLAAFVGGSLRDPDVAGALLIENPGHGAPGGRGSKGARERRAQNLLDGEFRAGGRDDNCDCEGREELRTAHLMFIHVSYFFTKLLLTCVLAVRPHATDDYS